jgi:6-phosphogluconate dehydrogenase
MQIGMIGLGRMGANIVRRLMKKGGHQAVVYDKNDKTVATVADEGATGATDLEDFVRKLARPRAVWIMLPAGAITETAIDTLAGRERYARKASITSMSAPAAACGASSAATA